MAGWLPSPSSTRSQGNTRPDKRDNFRASVGAGSFDPERCCRNRAWLYPWLRRMDDKTDLLLGAASLVFVLGLVLALIAEALR